MEPFVYPYRPYWFWFRRALGEWRWWRDDKKFSNTHMGMFAYRRSHRFCKGWRKYFQNCPKLLSTNNVVQTLRYNYLCPIKHWQQFVNSLPLQLYTCHPYPHKKSQPRPSLIPITLSLPYLPPNPQFVSYRQFHLHSLDITTGQYLNELRKKKTEVGNLSLYHQTVEYS